MIVGRSERHETVAREELAPAAVGDRRPREAGDQDDQGIGTGRCWRCVRRRQEQGGGIWGRTGGGIPNISLQQRLPCYVGYHELLNTNRERTGLAEIGRARWRHGE